MALNLNALRETKKDLDAKSGSKGFLNTKDLNENGIPFRLLPPPEILNGRFHFNVQEWWFPVNGKLMRIIDVSTFGKPSVIQAEIDAAYAMEDDDVTLVLDAINPNTKNKILIMQESAWMAGLQLEYKFSDDGSEIVGSMVVDNCAKIFQCGKPTLLSALINVATTRPAITRAKGCEEGIADRVKGSNILLTKTGAKLTTKYAAVCDEEMEMDAKYYRNIPNAYEIAKNQMQNPSWQRAAGRNYIFGEAIPADVQAKEDARVEKVKALHTASEEAPGDKKKAAPVADEDDDAPTAKKVVKKALAEDDEDDAPSPVKKAKKPVPELEEDEDDEPAPTPKKKAKPVVEDLDDEDADEVPAPKKKATAPKKQEPLDLDDEEDDAPAPVIKKKSPAPPAASAKKSAPAKAGRSVLDDLDMED